MTVIGIGASAGGLDACRKLVASLGDGHQFAAILVQHLDPAHESMMVELLAPHTGMTVRLAASGMPIEPGTLYVIPPGTYLTVANGALRVAQPQALQKARLPFDVLLLSLAQEFGRRAACIVLSGSGADGTIGLKAIRQHDGLVLVQDPKQADYDGMPRSAIATGQVDAVLPVERMAAALRMPHGDAVSDDPEPESEAAPAAGTADAGALAGIIETLRTTTSHDFRMYKRGTLLRRIQRRMAMAAIEPGDIENYNSLLDRSREERDLLARDLLINVTGFFRDPAVFEFLDGQVLPDMVRAHPPALPLRIWVAGCSTGEETYSLAILFSEAMAAAGLELKLQLFASDVDADAIATAREGLYSDSIEAAVSPQRLEAFFIREEHSYRIRPELRAVVVFTVQDLLADPPFSRLDFISCRNLLIYLVPEAQAKVLRLFHFALRPGGLLLLGSSENAGMISGRFEPISQAQRIYRHIGRSPPGELVSALRSGDPPRALAFGRPGPALSRQAAFAELCRQLVTENYAPAAVLINNRNECLHFLGPTDHYLQVAPGRPTHDLLAMARVSMRGRLRTAIHQSTDRNTNVVVRGGKVTRDGQDFAFNIAVRPVEQDGEKLLLVCFVNDPATGRKPEHPDLTTVAPRIAELELELEATRNELQTALESLEASSDEQKAINDEALSFNEEYQSTNEELVTSKEELQALNEELVALNGQLQDTLEKQRTTSNDLQNILYSTDMATLFLDTDLNIRFFTPATRALFKLIPGDVGRPLADLTSLSLDGDLLADARTMLTRPTPVEREIEAQNGTWYLRRILPYYTHDSLVGGVVVTFVDVSDRKRAKHALELAKQVAENANAAKSRFLTAVTHDLRQPLQTLTLVQGLLAKRVHDAAAGKLVAMLEPTIGAMSGMLNSLLDINQIDTGIVQPAVSDFPIAALLGSLDEEFQYHAEAKGLTLRVIPCSLRIRSDRRMLEQMIRNLMTNAIKYTRNGKILVGCRRHGETLSIEVRDTGIGIPEDQIGAIFAEYHQVDNPARERSRGLGLGLSIVQRLGDLLGHGIRVRSTPGAGSMFSIDVALAPPSADAPDGGTTPHLPAGGDPAPDTAVTADPATGSILIVEDDPELRHLLEMLLAEDAHRVMSAADGVVALDLIRRGRIDPDLVLADYNLPNGVDGLTVTAQLRERLHRRIPAIILTGDISPRTLEDIAAAGCLPLSKPIKARDLTEAIARMLRQAPNAPPAPQAPMAKPAVVARQAQADPVFIIDDDRNVRDAIVRVLSTQGYAVAAYATSEAFLDEFRAGTGACLLVDAVLPGMQGLDLLHQLARDGNLMPSIMITGNGDVPMAVEAMKAGASDFIEKPISEAELLASVARALENSQDDGKLRGWQRDAASLLASLTRREREVMEMVLAGHPSKNIAADLAISQRTVENHRASIMKKTSSKSLPALARLAMTAGIRTRTGQPALR